jgi:hypothetical protein
MKISSRGFLACFLFIAFAVAQWAAQVHGLSHLRHELSVASAFAHPLHDHGSHAGHAHEHDHDHDHAPAGDGPEPLDHAAELCLVFHGIDCKAAAPVAPPTHFAVNLLPQPGIQPLALTLAVSIPYHSRAPPAQRS